MRYLLHVRVGDNKKRTYRVDAADEAEARGRLLPRLAPHERDTLIIDSIEIDPATLQSTDGFGTFLIDNHD